MVRSKPDTAPFTQPAHFEKRFEWLVSFLICRFRFVHTVLGMMNKIPSDKIDTIGVTVTASGHLELYYNAAWLDPLTDEELTFVLYHEVLHVVLHHIVVRQKKNVLVWNVATDLAVNELIPQIRFICMPPKDKKRKKVGCFVDELKKINHFADIKERQTAEWYYAFLLEKASDLLSGKQNMDDHSGWKENELAEERIRAKIRRIEQNNLWGNLSQTDRELIVSKQEHRINWRNKIRWRFGTMASKQVTTTRKRPNRRTGFLHPGTRRKYTERLLVAADTSGSINKDLLAEWIDVLNGLAECVPIDFMQFDCEKTEAPHPYERRRMQLEFKGRGGTDFQPVIDIVNQRRYEGVMILTDGEAAAPSRPKRARVIWVMPVGCPPPVDWGECIYIEHHSE